MNEVDTTFIEMSSINKLETAFLRTGIIIPYISKNDKTPSWDGEVFLYKTKGNTNKSNLARKIPIQVKGTVVERFGKKRAGFQADVSDLRNYFNDKGVIFFLVQLKDFDTINEQI